MAQTSVPGGTILRGEDGTWYYIRDDMLEQFRVTDDETLNAFAELEHRQGEGEDEVGGFAMMAGGPMTFEQPSFLNIGFNNLALRANQGLGIGSC
jgi:hypothetical protein